jgi:hypothetical protein
MTVPISIHGDKPGPIGTAWGPRDDTMHGGPYGWRTISSQARRFSAPFVSLVRRAGGWVNQAEATMVTSRMLGVFRDRLETRHEFLSTIDLRGARRSGGLSI